jgi:hypothetical protein
MTDWTVEYDNDTGPGDEGYWEWWDLNYRGRGVARVAAEADARALAALFNSLAVGPPSRKEPVE